jgi:hypothetical protein
LGFSLEEWTINRELRDADAGPGERTADSVNAALLRAAQPSSPLASPGHQHIGWTRPNVANIASKSAALTALMALAPFEPVANVGYTSRGRLLLLADGQSGSRAERAAEALGSQLPVAIIWRGAPSRNLPADVEAVDAEVQSLAGYLGAFEVVFQPKAGAAQMASFDLVLDLTNPPQFLTWSASSKSPNFSPTKSPFARIAAARKSAAISALMFAAPKPFRPRAISSKSILTCAWAAALALRCVRQAR